MTDLIQPWYLCPKELHNLQVHWTKLMETARACRDAETFSEFQNEALPGKIIEMDAAIRSLLCLGKNAVEAKKSGIQFNLCDGTKTAIILKV